MIQFVLPSQGVSIRASSIAYVSLEIQEDLQLSSRSVSIVRNTCIRVAGARVWQGFHFGTYT